MQNLTRASQELFKRTSDETFEDMPSLWNFCHDRKQSSTELWEPPGQIRTDLRSDELGLVVNDRHLRMNNWSFSQLCQLCKVDRRTVNRLSAGTANQVFSETLPPSGKPLQIFEHEGVVRSIHGVSYTRLYDSDVLMTVREFATDFQPPQKGFNGATGLYAGEEDMFTFLIDPTGWINIGDEAFAPGFFIWNSEVGKRSLGIETFWFQAVCANHIVHSCQEVTTFTRKHTANVHEGMREIRRIIAELVEKRDRLKDDFAKTVQNAMNETLTPEEAMSRMRRQGVMQRAAKAAVEAVQESELTV